MKGEILSPSQEVRDSFRQTFHSFTKTVDAQSIQTAVNETIHATLPEEFEIKAQKYLERYLKFDILEDSPPSWINPTAFTRELLRPNSPTLWKSLIDHAEKQEPSISRRLLYDLHSAQIHEPELWDFDLSEAISNQDMRFIGTTMVYVGLASTYGTELLSATEQSEFYPATFPILQVGKSIASHYPTPPRNASDVIQRLQHVFSPDSQDINAYQLLLDNKAFDNPVKKRVTHQHDCLGVEITKDIFRSYADVLTQPDYQHHFIQAVTR